MGEEQKKPELPKWANCGEWIQHGRAFVAYGKDGRYSLQFVWDGQSASFNKLDIKVNDFTDDKVE